MTHPIDFAWGFLRGDGRRMIEPSSCIGKPMPVKLGQARRICESLARTGYSTHSRHGTTVWVAVRFCEERDLAYRLTRHVDAAGLPAGYLIELVDRCTPSWHRRGR